MLVYTLERPVKACGCGGLLHAAILRSVVLSPSSIASTFLCQHRLSQSWPLANTPLLRVCVLSCTGDDSASVTACAEAAGAGGQLVCESQETDKVRDAAWAWQQAHGRSLLYIRDAWDMGWYTGQKICSCREVLQATKGAPAPVVLTGYGQVLCRCSVGSRQLCLHQLQQVPQVCPPLHLPPRSAPNHQRCESCALGDGCDASRGVATHFGAKAKGKEVRGGRI